MSEIIDNIMKTITISDVISLIYLIGWIFLCVFLYVKLHKKIRVTYFKRNYTVINSRMELDKITESEWKCYFEKTEDGKFVISEMHNYNNYYCNPDFDIHGEPILTKENSRDYTGKKPKYGKEIFEYDFPILIPNGGKLVKESNIPKIIELIRK